MKQITIDYELYKQELENAREDGFNSVSSLLKKVKELYKISKNYQSAYEMRVKLFDILKEIEGQQS